MPIKKKHRCVRYAWSGGDKRYRGLKAEVAAKELKRLDQKHRGLTPVALVNEARSKNSVLHQAFTWEDGKAAELYRRVEARRLMGFCIEIQVTNGRKIALPVMSYAPVQQDHDIRMLHVATFSALKETAQRTSMIHQAYRALLAWQAKYGKLVEFRQVSDAIDSLDL